MFGHLIMLLHRGYTVSYEIDSYKWWVRCDLVWGSHGLLEGAINHWHEDRGNHK